MPITLGDIVTQVSAEINLGTTYDIRIPEKVRKVVRAFEKKVSFPYMRTRLIPVNLTAGDTGILFSSIISDPTLFKSVRMLRIIKSDGLFHYVKKIDERDVDFVDSDKTPPNGFWIDGVNGLVFDRVIAEDSTAEIILNLFTDPTNLSNNADTHWLFDAAEWAVICATMLFMAPTLRDEEIKGLYGEQLALEWDLLVEQIEDTDFDNTETYMEPFADHAST